MSFLTDDQFGQFGQFGQSGNAKMKPFPIEAEEFTPLNWKSGDALYPGERGGFNRDDRTLWRKDRYNAVYGRFRDKNGEYRDKSGRFIGENNMPLLEFRETKAFPGWANDPGSQFHPNDHPQVDEGFYRNPENQPGRGLENIGLRVWEDNWNEKGFPIKSEFHDFTTQPGIKEGVNAALRMVDAGQLQDKFPMAAAQALQKVHNSLNAAARQPQVENNTLYQIGELIKSAAPLIGQALSAVMGGTGAEGQAGGPASEVEGTAASMATMPATQPVPELRTADHRFDDGFGRLMTWEKGYTDEPPQLTPMSASSPASASGGGAGGNVGGSVGGSAGTGSGPNTGGTAGPVAGPGYGPVAGTGYGTDFAPGGGGYPGGETPSGGAGFENQSLPSGGGYPGGVVQAPGNGVGNGKPIDRVPGQSIQVPASPADYLEGLNQDTNTMSPGYSGKMAGADSEHQEVDKDLLRTWISEIYKNDPDAREGWDFENIDYGQGQKGKQGLFWHGVKSSAEMTKDWALGTGPKHRIFGPGSIEVENMKDAPGVNGARNLAMEKIRKGIHKPTLNCAGKFGLEGSSGPIKAGQDPTEQFVGSYRVDVIPDAENENLTFIVTNTTSFDSFLYGRGPAWNRNNKIQTPMGNIRQMFTWTERIAK